MAEASPAGRVLPAGPSDGCSIHMAGKVPRTDAVGTYAVSGHRVGAAVRQHLSVQQP